MLGLGSGAAAQGTPEARQACTPDAMRLCSDFISDGAGPVARAWRGSIRASDAHALPARIRRRIIRSKPDA